MHFIYELCVYVCMYVCELVCKYVFVCICMYICNAHTYVQILGKTMV